MIPVVYIETRHTKRLGPHDRFKMNLASTTREGYIVLLHTRVANRFHCYICHKKLSPQPSRQHIFVIEKNLFYKLTAYIAQQDMYDMGDMLAHSLFVDTQELFTHVVVHNTPCVHKFFKILNAVSE